MPRFSITTLGCKVNQYDGEALAAALERAGLRWRRGADEAADLAIVNTCCVTAAAMAKSRQAIRRAARDSPDAVIFITGCYADYDPGRIRAVLAEAGVPPGRVLVAGHHGDLAACAVRLAERLPPLTGGRPGGAPPAASETPGGPEDLPARRLAAVRREAPGSCRLGPIGRFHGHQRAFVKVQDGCDAFCAYCVVPYTRPVVRWRPAEEVLAECRALVAAGHREIVLCGVFLGAYGRPTAIRRRWDGPGSHLTGLLRQVAGIDGLWRVRLSSLEPGDVTDDLLAAFRELPRAAPHFHLPVQSGSDDILRRMNRQYTVAQYRRTVDRIRATLDRPAITTDVLVGFPGEDDGDFARTLELARHAGFARIHAFPFSPVRGTAAWRRRHEAPPPQVVRDRMAALADLGRGMACAYRRQFVGEELEGLVEAAAPRGPALYAERSGPGGSGRIRRAMTDRYIAVDFACPPGQGDLTGQVVRLRIAGLTPSGLAGDLAGMPTAGSQARPDRLASSRP